jgi:hypothetical protein
LKNHHHKSERRRKNRRRNERLRTYRRNRQEYEEQERIRFKRLLRQKRREEKGKRRLPPIRPVYVTVAPPRRFSLIRNPSEMAAFLRRVKEESRPGVIVYIDLSRLTELTSDGIAVLLAWIKDERYPIAIRGRAPEDPRLRTILERSGFYEHVTPQRNVSTTLRQRQRFY